MLSTKTYYSSFWTYGQSCNLLLVVLLIEKYSIIKLLGFRILIQFNQYSVFKYFLFLNILEIHCLFFLKNILVVYKYISLS